MYFVDMMLVLMFGIQCHNTSFLKNKKDMMLKCHQKLAKDDVDFKSYYDVTDETPASVNMLRIKGDDNQFKCALYLKGCIKGCECGESTEPLLINSDQDVAGTWSVECKQIETYTKFEQRSVADTNAVPKPKAQTADGAVAGDLPPTDPSALLSVISQSNNPAPRMVSTPVASSDVSTDSGVANSTDTDNNQTGSVDLLDELKSIYHDLDALNAISTDDADGIARSLDFEDPDTVLTTTSEGADETTTNAEATAETSTTTTSTTTTSTTTTTTATAEAVTSSEDELKKDERVLEKDGDVLVEDVDELGALQTKYYVVVAFVVLFLLILVIIAVVLFVKMKKTRGGMQIISPGPIDQEPLTPSGNHGAFKFDGDRT